MKLIAFDIGSHMAAAHNGAGNDDRRVTVEVFKGDRVTRAAATALWLRETFARLEARWGPFDAVAYERPFARGQAATRALWGIAGLIDAEATNAGMAVLDFTPAEIKEYAAGKGNADKDAMTFAAQMLGYLGEDEHEADTWCLLDYCINKLKKGPAPCPKPSKSKASPPSSRGPQPPKAPTLTPSSSTEA